MIKKRMIYLALVTMGMLGIAFAQKEAYAILAGVQQLLFRVPALLCFMWLLHAICKGNDIKKPEELHGVRNSMPYIYAIMVMLALFIIGVPGTGSFTGILYAQMGSMYAQTGVISYVGLLGNMAGMLATAILIFPILKEAFMEEKKAFVKPRNITVLCTGLIAVLMLVLSVCHNLVTEVLSKII